jgi:hypothetical protein
MKQAHPVVAAAGVDQAAVFGLIAGTYLAV